MPDTSDTNATRVSDKRHVCNTSETRATQMQHKCDTRATRMTRVRHEWKVLILISTRFAHLYLYYMGSQRLQGQEQFHSKNYLLEMSRFHAKMCLKSAPQKLNFLMAKAILKSCTLDCSWNALARFCIVTQPHFR